MVLTRTRKTAASVQTSTSRWSSPSRRKRAEEVAEVRNWQEGDQPGPRPTHRLNSNSLPSHLFTRSITGSLEKRSMGRTRTKSKHVRPQTCNQSSSASSSTTPSVSALISKAQSIIEQCDYDLANQFIQRILQKSPNSVEAREMLGVVQIETGLVQEARKVGSRFSIYLFF